MVSERAPAFEKDLKSNGAPAQHVGNAGDTVKNEKNDAAAAAQAAETAVERGGVLGSFFGGVVLPWLKTYFLAGQYLRKPLPEEDKRSWLIRHRRLVSFIIPPIVAYTVWITYMAVNNLWYKFTALEPPDNTPNWYMSVTMAFGSFIAGSTSEGGASVAFPVMTLVYGIAPAIARDFSFAIQSCGMTAASATIVMMGVQVDLHALLYGTIGGVAGIIIGLEQVVPRLYPANAKMFFVSIWASFAASLYWLNKLHGRRVFREIPDWERGQLAPSGPLRFVNWKAIVLVLFGVLGGIFSAIGGAGLDICLFSALTLFFRVSEKVATPTSVLLMAGNTLVGFTYTQFKLGGIEPRAYDFLAVCVPVVVVCAPLGALCSSHWHRLVHASLVYVIDLAQLITALYVIQPWTYQHTDEPIRLTASSAALLVGGFMFFTLVALAGQRLLLHLGYPLLSDKALESQKGGAEKSADGMEAGEGEGLGLSQGGDSEKSGLTLLSY